MIPPILDLTSQLTVPVLTPGEQLAMLTYRKCMLITLPYDAQVLLDQLRCLDSDMV